MKENKEKIEERIELIKKHHIFLWLILLFPVGIYKSIKYKIFPKVINVILIILFLLVGIILTDTIIHPNSALYYSIAKELKSADYDIGEIKTVYESDVKGEYYITTSSGKYLIQLDESSSIKDLKFSKIEEITPERRIIKCDNNDSTDLYLEINDFINQNAEEYNLGTYTNIKETISRDIQTIQTSTGIYKFLLCDKYIKEVYKIQNNNENLIYKNDQINIKLPESIIDFIKNSSKKDKIGDIVRTYDYALTKDGQVYYIEMSKANITIILYDDKTIEMYIK